MGASFGAERQLAFQHESSGISFSFPQRNGDVFAFDSDVNRAFKHGVPKTSQGSCGPRFSIIAWGRRRCMSSRNGGSGGGARAPEAPGAATRIEEGGPQQRPQQQRAPEHVNERVMTGSEMLATVADHARAAMRAEARKVRDELGRRRYKELRRVSQAVQTGGLSVEAYVRDALSIVDGDKRPVFALLPFLPDEALGAAIRNELMCS